MKTNPKLFTSSYLVITVVLFMIGMISSQRLEAFESGIIKMAPRVFNQNQEYRDFTITSSQRNLITTGGNLIFSLLSFSYIQNEAYCQRLNSLASSMASQTLSITIRCSSNIHKISYLLIQPLPNLFILHQRQTYYELDIALSHQVDISSWVAQLSFPLNEMKNQSNQNFQNNQPVNRISVRTFISGMQFFGQQMKDTTKGKVVYVNFNVFNMIDNKTQLVIPTTLIINRSINIKTVAFFVIVVIEQFTTLNFQFSQVQFLKNSGNISLGYFAGLTQFQSIISTYNITNLTSISLNISLNSSQKVTSMSQQPFQPRKLYSFNFTQSLSLNLTSITNFSYLRCTESGLTKLSTFKWPVQGKSYRITSALLNTLILIVSTSSNDSNNLVVSTWQNLDNQKFYFKYNSSTNTYKIFNFQTNYAVKASATSNGARITSSVPSLDVFQNWQLIPVLVKGIYYYFLKNSYSNRVMDVSNANTSSGSHIILFDQYSASTNQMWTLQQLEDISNLSIASVSENITWTSSYNHAIINSSMLMQNTSSQNYYNSTYPYGFYNLNSQQCSYKACISNGIIQSNQRIPFNISLFERSYQYCINKDSLKNFDSQINVQQLINFPVNNSLYQSLQEINTTYFGCTNYKNLQSKFTIIDNIITNYTTQQQCQKCQEGYMLANATIFLHKAQSCYCNLGYFMDLQGNCHLCNALSENCQLTTKILATLIEKSPKYNYSQYISIQVKFPVESYTYLTDLSTIESKILVSINGLLYNSTYSSFQYTNDSKIILSVQVVNFTSANSYKIYVKINQSKLDSSSYILIQQKQQTANYAMASSTIQGINQSTSTSVSEIKNRIFFSRFQTTQISIYSSFKAQKVIQSLQPVINTLNTTTSILLMASPLISQKLNMFSIFQTNSLLYLISFLKFQPNKITNSIKQTTKSMFIFRPLPWLNLFSVRKSQQNSQSYFQINGQKTQFQKYFIFKSQLCYPNQLYESALPSLNQYNSTTIPQDQHSYLTLTLNTIITIMIQILGIELLLMISITLLSRTSIINAQSNQVIKQKIVYRIRRHQCFSLSRKQISQQVLQAGQSQSIAKVPQQQKPQAILIDQTRYIQWLPSPNLKQPSKGSKDQPHSQQKMIQQDLPSLRHKILFILQGVKNKRFINYSSFAIIQLISQSFLIYFQLIKPLYITQGNQIMAIVNTLLGLFVMFIILILPIGLINYQPLHLLKIVSVIYKFGNYQFKSHQPTNIGKHCQNCQLQIEQKSKCIEISKKKQKTSNYYTYGQIYSYFILTYYQNIFCSFSIAMGNEIFYQALPIFLYQIIKLIWMFKKLKVIQKIKILILAFIFFVFTSWKYIQLIDSSQAVNFQIFFYVEQTIIYCICSVLIIQFIKILKFFVVQILNFIKKIIQIKKQKTAQLTNKQFISKQILRQITIIDIQDQLVDQTDIKFQQKVQKVQKLKKKAEKLKQLTIQRQKLQSDLVDIQNKRLEKSQIQKQSTQTFKIQPKFKITDI